MKSKLLESTMFATVSIACFFLVFLVVGLKINVWFFQVISYFVIVFLASGGFTAGMLAGLTAMEYISGEE